MRRYILPLLLIVFAFSGCATVKINMPVELKNADGTAVYCPHGATIHKYIIGFTKHCNQEK